MNYLLFNNQWVIEKLLVVFFLDGRLDLDYDVVVNTVHTMSTTPSFEEI